jgi:hypothetical protein
MKLSRCSFAKTTAAAALAAGTPGTGAGPGVAPAFIWGALLHMGTNMWSDVPVKQWGAFKPEEVHLICEADHLRFDETVWQTLTARMKAAGMNLVVIDLGEALQYQSHPELSVKGSWPIARFRAELTRLRAMGLEPIGFAEQLVLWRHVRTREAEIRAGLSGSRQGGVRSSADGVELEQRREL